jgi:hypothetical protein
VVARADRLSEDLHHACDRSKSAARLYEGKSFAHVV